jgi:hypothetical protein
MSWLVLLSWQELQDLLLMGGMCIPFSVLYGFCCLLETWVGRVPKVAVVPSQLPCLVEMLRWLSFIFIWNCYVFNKLKTQLLCRCFVCCTIYLWSLSCALLSLFRGYIPSFVPWFVNTRLKSSCLLVATFCTIIFETAIQFCLWLLTSCWLLLLSSTQLFNWHWGHTLNP